jgi:ADP-heptose:LPS heptosyltransferase
MKTSKLKEILIIQTAFIGDTILGTAVLEKIHAHYPAVHLYYLVRKGNEVLFDKHPFLKEVWTIDKSRKFSSLVEELKKIRARKFDLVINLHRYASSNLLTILSGANFKYGYHNFPLSLFFSVSKKHSIGDGRHEVERNHSLIETFTDRIVNRPKIYPSTSDFQLIEKYTEVPYVCIFPASIWFTKQWPNEKWIELCHRLKDKKIYLLGGKNDVKSCEEIILACPHQPIESLAGKLTLLQSAALMKNAVMNFVNDSGPLHLASAMNAPVTAIFCSTVKSFGFTPLSDNSHVIETDENLSCRPCGLHGHPYCPKGHFNCAVTISAEKVISHLPDTE